MYKNGKVTGHEGAWVSGVAGAKFGLMLPGTPLLGARYYQEMAPKVAMDRAEIVALGVAMKTPADLPLIVSRLLLIEEVAFDAMDEVNADAFAEAYKDLVNMYARLTRP